MPGSQSRLSPARSFPRRDQSNPNLFRPIFFFLFLPWFVKSDFLATKFTLQGSSWLIAQGREGLFALAAMLEKIGLPPKPSMRGATWVVDASHCQGCSVQFSLFTRKVISCFLYLLLPCGWGNHLFRGDLMMFWFAYATWFRSLSPWAA